MPRYLLRAIRQVQVFELTGKEKIVDCETESKLNLEGVAFLKEIFGNDITVELDIKQIPGEEPISREDAFAKLDAAHPKKKAPF